MLSRRKDRERLFERRRLNPDYRGFRGADQDPTGGGNTPLQMVTCSICGRRRNVALGIAQEQGDSYVCISCTEAAERESHQEEVVG